MNGQRHGFGTIYEANGSVTYQGQFVDGEEVEKSWTDRKLAFQIPVPSFDKKPFPAHDFWNMTPQIPEIERPETESWNWDLRRRFIELRIEMVGEEVSRGEH